MLSKKMEQAVNGQLNKEMFSAYLYMAMSAYADEYANVGEELVIVLNIMSARDKRFNGLDILDVLLANGFNHGEMNIFHYFHNETDRIPVCSIANVVEPGIFELELIESVNTPGLSLFMQLPGKVDGRKAFEIMLDKGRTIAEQLEGDLCDETRSVLTMQTQGI